MLCVHWRRLLNSLLITGFIFLISSMPAAAASVITVNTLAAGIAVDGQCSLAEAILNANAEGTVIADCASGGADTVIELQNATYNFTAVDNETEGPSALPAITGTVTINGNGAVLNRDTSSGQTPYFRLLLIYDAETVVINNLTVQNGHLNTLDQDGGGILAYNSDRLENTTSVTFNTVTVQDNRAGRYGGGLAAYQTNTVHLNNITALRNTTSNAGGGANLYATQASTVENSTFSHNDGGKEGGGLVVDGYIDITQLSMTNVTATNNQASEGGGILFDSVAVNASGLRIDTNTADGSFKHGGGIYAYALRDSVITNSVFSNNQSADKGGGFYQEYSYDTLIQNSLFYNNQAGSEGGGAYNWYIDGLALLNNTFSANTAAKGGGVGVGAPTSDYHYLNLYFNTFVNNTASDGGAAFYDGRPGGARHIFGNVFANSTGGGNCASSDSSPIPSLGYNISDDVSCLFSATGDQNGVAAGVDTTLADNGGPTLTHALTDLSPAVDKVPTNLCVYQLNDDNNEPQIPVETDQRGVNRPVNQGCDAGAFESSFGTPSFELVYLTSPFWQSSQTITQSITLVWPHQAAAQEYIVNVYDPYTQLYGQTVSAGSACGISECTLNVPTHAAVGEYQVWIAPQAGPYQGSWSYNPFTTLPGATTLTYPTNTIAPAENIDLTFPMPLGAYFIVVDVYYPNGGYQRSVIEAPQCNAGTCVLSVPSYWLWGDFSVWMVSGYWPYFGSWSNSTFRVGIGEATLTAPTGSQTITDSISLTFNMPAGAYYTVVDVYYPNGGYLREVVEVPGCPGGVCTVSVPSYGLTGHYGVWMVPGWGQQFGNWAFSGFTLTEPAPGGWQVTTIDNSRYTGRDTSIAVVDGQPAISYYDESLSALKYTRFNGTTWDITIVDNSGTVGRHTSLAVVNGQPAISYFDYTNKDLKYAHFNGTTWDTETVDGAGSSLSVGEYTSLAVVDGQPAISYYKAATSSLQYARYNGSSWDIQTVDDDGHVGECSSIALIGGQPAISYYDRTNDNLKYTRFNGTSWQTETVNNTGDVGCPSSLVSLNGQPAISYYDATNKALKYAVYNGSAWDTQTLTTSEIGSSSSALALIDGLPVVAYNNGGLSVARFDGTSWNAEVADSTVYQPTSMSMAVLNGQPIISYHDVGSSNLKFAMYVPGAVDGPLPSPLPALATDAIDVLGSAAGPLPALDTSAVEAAIEGPGN